MNTQTKTGRAKIDDPFGQGWDPQPAQDVAVVTGPQRGPQADAAEAAIVTAQRVAVKRNIPDILRDAKAIATARGLEMVYRIPFKERRDGVERTVVVEGISIKGAMVAVSCYGNLKVGARLVAETPTHWLFEAQLIDAEKGVTVQRPFQQRRAMSTGMKDASRAADAIFQIGVSKAMRNVIEAALPWLCREIEDAAKSGVLDRIANNQDGARAFLLERMAELGIAVSNVCRTLAGRTPPKWTVPDMARLYVEIESIRDGMADADDLYPPLGREEDETPPAEAKKPAPSEPPPAAPPADEPAPAAAEPPADDPPPTEPPAPPKQRRAPRPPADEEGLKFA